MNLFHWSGFEYRDTDGAPFGDGSLDSPDILSGLTLSYMNSMTLTQNSSGTLWSSSQGGPTDFNYCRIIADQGDASTPVMLEMTTDLAASVATGYFTQGLMKNLPFEIFCSTSYANYTANFGGGTLKTIGRFRVKNLNASTATVKIWLFD